MTTIDDMLPTAQDLQNKLALAQAEKAAETARRLAAEAAEKKSLAGSPAEAVGSVGR